MKNTITRFALSLTTCALICLSVGAQDSTAFPDENQIYEIKEFTYGQRVAVGDGGNVLRWAPTGKMEQQFRFVIVDDDQFKWTYPMR